MSSKDENLLPREWAAVVLFIFMMLVLTILTQFTPKVHPPPQESFEVEKTVTISKKKERRRKAFHSQQVP